MDVIVMAKSTTAPICSNGSGRRMFFSRVSRRRPSNTPESSRTVCPFARTI